jgi:hypothetical protein
MRVSLKNGVNYAVNDIRQRQEANVLFKGSLSTVTKQVLMRDLKRS